MTHAAMRKGAMTSRSLMLLSVERGWRGVGSVCARCELLRCRYEITSE